MPTEEFDLLTSNQKFLVQSALDGLPCLTAGLGEGDSIEEFLLLPQPERGIAFDFLRDGGAGLVGKLRVFVEQGSDQHKRYYLFFSRK